MSLKSHIRLKWRSFLNELIQILNKNKNQNQKNSKPKPKPKGKQNNGNKKDSGAEKFDPNKKPKVSDESLWKLHGEDLKLMKEFINSNCAD